MRKVKEYFHMIFAAVVFLAVSLFSGKVKKDEVNESGSVFPGMKKSAESACAVNRRDMDSKEVKAVFRLFPIKSYIKKIFFWLQGPGDMPFSSEIKSQWKKARVNLSG